MDDDTLFFDLEASGLHPTSHPVEVAWVAHDLTAARSNLIQPAEDWSDWDWHFEAEGVHKLSRDWLFQHERILREHGRSTRDDD